MRPADAVCCGARLRRRRRRTFKRRVARRFEESAPRRVAVQTRELISAAAAAHLAPSAWRLATCRLRCAQLHARRTCLRVNCAMPCGETASARAGSLIKRTQSCVTRLGGGGGGRKSRGSLSASHLACRSLGELANFISAARTCCARTWRPNDVCELVSQVRQASG